MKMMVVMAVVAGGGVHFLFDLEKESDERMSIEQMLEMRVQHSKFEYHVCVHVL